MIILSPHGCGDNPKQCGDSGDKLTRRVPQACPSLPLVCESVFAARKAPTTRPHRTRQLTPTAEALSWSSSRSTGHRAPGTEHQGQVRSGQVRPGQASRARAGAGRRPGRAGGLDATTSASSSRPRLRRCPGRQDVPQQSTRDRRRQAGASAGSLDATQNQSRPSLPLVCESVFAARKAPTTRPPPHPPAHAYGWGAAPSWSSSRSTGHRTPSTRGSTGTGKQGPGLAQAAVLVVLRASMQPPSASSSRPRLGRWLGRQDVPQTKHRGQSTRDRRRQGPGLAASMPPRTKAANPFPWCVSVFAARKAPTTRPHRTRPLTPTPQALSWSSGCAALELTHFGGRVLV